MILIFLGRLSLERRVTVFTEIQGTPAHRNQGGPRGECHSSGQRSVHRGEHRPRMLLAHQLGGGEFVLVVPTSLLLRGVGVCVNPAGGRGLKTSSTTLMLHERTTGSDSANLS